MAPHRVYHMVVERDEDDFLVGNFPELPGCHTQAKDLKTLVRRMREAIALSLETNPS